VKWFNDACEVVNKGGVLRKINGINCVYQALSIDDIKPEDRRFVALLDAMPMDEDNTTRLMDGTGTYVVASRVTWASVHNYWIHDPETLK
jgi:hypothetical protein